MHDDELEQIVSEEVVDEEELDEYGIPKEKALADDLDEEDDDEIM